MGIKITYLFFAILFYTFPAFSQDKSAIFLMYHRFGEEAYPSTNVKMDAFKNQIKALVEQGHNFPEMTNTIERLKNKSLHPDRSVLITVDDGYKSILTQAWPILKAHNIPLTIFIATDPIDSGQNNYLSWDDIRKLSSEGVEIAHHGANHGHGPRQTIEIFKADIIKANKRFLDELGFVPKIYAYPYGEYTPEMQSVMVELGFEAAFGQFSGAAGPSDNIMALPRFPINENYSDLSRFNLIINSLALPVSNVVPATPLLNSENNPPSFGFSIQNEISNINNLACYPSHLGKAADINFIGNKRVEVRFDVPFPEGRNRINCTLPGPNGRWYWFGRPFLIQD